MDNITEIGNNLKSYEQSNWDLLRKRTMEIFNKEFKDYQEKLNNSNVKWAWGILFILGN